MAAGPPRALLIASVAVLVVALAMSILGAFQAGISTDEPIHVMRLRNLLDNGWYALDWDYVGAGPGSADTNTFVYGPVTMLLLHGWSVLWGVEGWGDVATTPHAYDVRHLGVVVIAAVGLVGVAALGRVLLRSWGWGVVAAAALAAIPMWTGHSMYNVKDIPVATGYTFFTLGAAVLVRRSIPSWRLRVAGGVSVVGGLALALGTRPGMWSGLLATLLTTIVAIVLVAPSLRVAIVSLGELLASCLVAAGVLVATYPNLFGSPFKALPRTAEGSASFLAGLKSDRLYVPRHLVEEMPILLLACVLTGSVVGVGLVWRGLWTHTVLSGRVAIIGVQAFVLPLAAIVLGSDLYHGLRQLLFAAPASAVIAAYGMAWLLARSREGRFRRVVPVALVAAVVLPMVDQAFLFPYQPTYVNVATDLVVRPFSTPDKRPGGDFWRLSIPELIEGVDLDGQLLCKAMVTKDGSTAYRFTNGGKFSTSRSLDCREEPNGPLAPSGLEVRRDLPPQEFLAVFLKHLPDNCTPVNDVSRWRHGSRVQLTVLGRCTDVPPVLDENGVSVTSASLGTGYDHDLWRFAADGWERWPSRDVLTAPVPLARIGLRPTSSCQAAGCGVVIGGSMPTDADVSVNGSPVAFVRSADGLRVPITAQQAQADAGVWITLTRPSGERLDATLTSLRIQNLDENTEGTR